MHKDALNLPAPHYWCCCGRLKLSTTRCYWCCSGRLKLSDGQVLLVLLWPSQAVDDQVLLVLLWPSQAVRRPGAAGVALAVSSCRRPGTAGTAVSVSYCLTARYCWYCSGHLKLSDGQVLLQRFFPLNRQLQLLQVGELPFSFSYEKKI
jgi:hypothetical protein